MVDIAICCNNFCLINILKGHIHKFSQSNNIRFKISIFNSLEEIENSKNKKFKVLLLSLRLYNKNEIFNINKRLNLFNDTTQVIYIPNFIDFVTNGFYLKDFRVLLKPLDYFAFCNEFEICVDSYNDIHNSNPMSIYFINSLNDRCVAYTDKDYHLIPMSINFLEKKLDNTIFFRCNEKCIINLHQIRKITKDYVIISDNIITIDKAKFSDLKYKLLNILKL